MRGFLRGRYRVVQFGDVREEHREDASGRHCFFGVERENRHDAGVANGRKIGAGAGAAVGVAAHSGEIVDLFWRFAEGDPVQPVCGV
jgi:hypothetical protein